MSTKNMTIEREKKLKQNIWKFYLYRFFSSMIFVIPIFVLFLQENGLSMTQVMILQAVYTAVIMLAVIPAGIFADYIGRKTALVINSIFFTLGWTLYALSHTFFAFLITEIFMAISAALWNSSGTAFFYDTLKELKQESKFKHLYGNTMTISHIVWGLSALVGGYLATYSLRLPYFAVIPPVFLSILVTLSFTETKKYKHGDQHYITHLKDAVKFSITHPKVKFFIIYAALFGAVFFNAFMVYQPYLKQIQIPLIYFGVVFMFMDFIAAFASKIAHKVEEFFGEKKILLIMLALAIFAYAGMSLNILYFGALFLLISSFVGGLKYPIIMDYINKHVSSHHRATVMALSDLSGSMLCTLSAPFIGWLIDFWGLKEAFIFFVILLVINLIILLWTFHLNNNRNKLK